MCVALVRNSPFPGLTERPLPISGAFKITLIYSAILRLVFIAIFSTFLQQVCVEDMSGENATMVSQVRL